MRWKGLGKAPQDSARQGEHSDAVKVAGAASGALKDSTRSPQDTLGSSSLPAEGEARRQKAVTV